MGMPRCEPCGTACPAGYTTERGGWTTCGSGVSTSVLIGQAAAIANLAIGCVPCELPSGSAPDAIDGMTDTGACQFACKVAIASQQPVLRYACFR